MSVRYLSAAVAALCFAGCCAVPPAPEAMEPLADPAPASVTGVTLSSQAAPTPPASESLTPLTLALYGYVPDLTVFEAAISNAWVAAHPQIPVAFTSWDPYAGEPPAEADVFVYDVSRFEPLCAAGLLEPIPVDALESPEDFWTGALRSVATPLPPADAAEAAADAAADALPERVYGLPQMICASFLVTRQDDARFEGVFTLSALAAILPPADADAATPAGPDGLAVACVWPEDVFYLYWHALRNVSGAGAAAQPGAASAAGHTRAVEALRTLVSRAGRAAMRANPEAASAYFRMGWLADGKVSAFVGYPESLNEVSDASRYRIMPFAYGTNDVRSVFYVNAAGVRAGLDPARREQAFALATLAVSDEVMTAVCAAPGANGSPQYLLPGRRSTLRTLAARWPGYARLLELVGQADDTPGGFPVFRGPTAIDALRAPLSAELNTLLFGDPATPESSE